MNLQEAIKQIKTDRQIKELRVDLKSWVRISRDLRQLSFVQSIPYSQTPENEKWLWHAKKAISRFAEIRVLGVRIICER